jgi:hypothetical protein
VPKPLRSYNLFIFPFFLTPFGIERMLIYKNVTIFEKLFVFWMTKVRGPKKLLGNRWNEVWFFCLLWGRNGGTKILTTHKGGVLKAPGLLILFGEDGDVICCHQWWEPPCLQGPKSFYILFGRGWRYKFLPPMWWINMPSMGLLFLKIWE